MPPSSLSIQPANSGYFTELFTESRFLLFFFTVSITQFKISVSLSTPIPHRKKLVFIQQNQSSLANWTWSFVVRLKNSFLASCHHLLSLLATPLPWPQHNTALWTSLPLSASETKHCLEWCFFMSSGRNFPIFLPFLTLCSGCNYQQHFRSTIIICLAPPLINWSTRIKPRNLLSKNTSKRAQPIFSFTTRTRMSTSILPASLVDLLSSRPVKEQKDNAITFHKFT